MRTRVLAAMAVVLSLAAPLAALDVGKPAPDFKLGKSWNVPAGSKKFSDYKGRIVWLISMATYSDSSLNALDHVNKLYDKFKDNDLTLLAAVADKEADVQRVMIKHRQIAWGVTVANISKAYDYTNFPHSWLIDREGTCIWKGNPVELMNDALAAFLVENPPLRVERRLSGHLKNAVGYFNDGEVGLAMIETQKVAEDPANKAAKEDSEYLLELCKLHLGKWESAIKRAGKDLVAKAAALDKGGMAFKGTDTGTKWEKESAEIKALPEYTGWQELHRITLDAKYTAKSETKRKYEALAEKYAGTDVANEAAKLARQIA